MSWGDVTDSKPTGSGRFLSFKDKNKVLVRVLDEEPFTTYVHKMSQFVDGQDKFITIPATQNLDEDYIQQQNGKRYPAVKQFNIRVHEYTNLDDNSSVDGEIRILQGGPMIFKPMRQLYEEHGSLSEFDILIIKEGEARDTEYTVTASPRSRPLDVEERQAEAAADETMAWDNVFQPVTAQDQQRMILEAGMDILYDPAAEIAGSMTFEQAKDVAFTFGKHKDKTVGDLLITDSGYVSWAAENVTSNDRLAAACRVAVQHMSSLEKPTKQASLPPKSAPKAKSTAKSTKAQEKASAAQPAPSTTSHVDRAGLIGHINEAFASNPKFEDAMQILNVIQKHGDGKTKVKDLTTDQLQSLLAEVKG